MKPFRILLLAGLLLVTSAFSTEEISAERKAQEKLPQSHDDMWKTLMRCKVHYNPVKYTFSITFTDQVKAMVGKPMTISGFMMPLEPKEKFTHYLLSRRTPTCPFCPPGEPNEIIEIFSKKPVKWDEAMVNVTGTFKFTNNPDMGLFFQLKESELTNGLPPEPKHNASNL